MNQEEHRNNAKKVLELMLQVGSIAGTLFIVIPPEASKYQVFYLENLILFILSTFTAYLMLLNIKTISRKLNLKNACTLVVVSVSSLLSAASFASIFNRSILLFGRPSNYTAYSSLIDFFSIILSILLIWYLWKSFGMLDRRPRKERADTRG